MAGHGGARKGAGRKRKDEEDKAKELTIKALVEQFGSEQKAFSFAAKQIKDGDKNAFNYFKLLIEYGYGKPKESVDVTSNGEGLSFKDLLKFGSTE